MPPIKIIILIFLLYLGYRLITIDIRKKRKTKKKDSSVNSSVVDELVEDPVCKSLTPKKQAIRLKTDEGIIYFCSEECCNKYIYSAKKRHRL